MKIKPTKNFHRLVFLLLQLFFFWLCRLRFARVFLFSHCNLCTRKRARVCVCVRRYQLYDDSFVTKMHFILDWCLFAKMISHVKCGSLSIYMSSLWFSFESVRVITNVHIYTLYSFYTSFSIHFSQSVFGWLVDKMKDKHI